jgi:dienelactone hydrolase
MFDTLHAPAGVRGSWFWAHTTAAMRALTCLQTRRDVDAARLGMTGFSAGGVASLLAAGADDRVRAAVPVSGTLAWDVATRAPAAWELSLLSRAGLSVAGREWQVLVKQLADPQAGVGGAGARVLMLNGTTDEFFPLTAHLATLRALAGSPGGSELRTGLTANFDHGCYKVNGGESAAAIEQRLVVHAEGGQRAFFRHHLAADPEYPAMPRSAQLGATAAGGQTRFVANVDRPRGYEIDEVRLWWSDDAAYSYRSVPLVGKSPTAYEALAPLTLTDSTIYFVDVQYRTVNLLSPHRFAISSEPVVPPGLVPHIRAYGSCR